MKALLEKLMAGVDLSREEAAGAMDAMMSGTVPPVQVAAFLATLRAKGETVPEIAGLAESMRRHATKLPIVRQDLIDTCGTGGDGAQTFNISTVNAFMVAAAGAGVVKHGNRSISSRCGSADVLEALGVAIDLSPERTAASVDSLGFGFLFARSLHPCMKHVAPIRTELGIRTVFNLLGPLTNPAGAKRQVIGIYDGSLLEKLALVLKEMGSEEVMLVHGDDGLDEITLTGGTKVAHLKAGKVRSFRIEPEELGLVRCQPEELRGGDAKENAAILEGILAGTITGPKRDIVLLNTAAALLVLGKAPDLRQGLERAREILASKAPLAILDKAKRFR